MSGIGTAIGLALATTTAVLLVITINQAKDDVKKNLTDTYRNPKGPDVQFMLFLRNNTVQNLIIGDSDGLNNSGFNTSYPTKIITHGFKSSIEEEVFQIIKNGVEIAGKTLSNFLNWLSNNGVALDDVHLIGHSLGAHVMGVAGDRVIRGKVGRITGLDPAGPGYNDIRSDLKLDPQDGKLVEVVHTYMKVLSLDHPLAESIFCNHGRAYRLFAESIRNNKSFKSKKCNSVEDALYSRCFEDTEVYMGHPETYKVGLYFFQTAPREPYSLS
ncbi:unnamed protein product [Brassicogethes aeneus]|uniref:Lipase domain-containing protein n=1 Tax=Brassicogethes aeneus TaxID=1431903 RepID=A0A9P0ASZ5_BRAAE|nr:unnamed protein product [Brassicogethes aeneus]